MDYTEQPDSGPDDMNITAVDKMTALIEGGDLTDDEEDSELDNSEPETEVGGHDDVEDPTLDASEDDEEFTDEDEHDEEPEEQPDLHKFKGPDGEEVEVTTQELYNSYNRYADYNRKLKTLNDEKRQVQEQTWNQANEVVLTHLNALNDFKQTLDPIISSWEQLGYQGKMELLNQNPNEYHRRQMIYNQRVEAYQHIAEQRNQIQQKMVDDFTNRQVELIYEKRPEWSQPDTWNSVSQEMRDYMSEFGFEAQDFDQIMDHRVFLLLEDAIKTRQGKASIGSKKVKGQAKAPRVVKTGSSNAKVASRMQNKSSKLVQRAKRTNDARDKTEALAAFFNDA